MSPITSWIFPGQGSQSVGMGAAALAMPGVAAMFDAAIARGDGALDAAAAARLPG